MSAERTPRRPASLALRVTVFIGIATTLIFLVFGWIVERSIEHHFAEQDADELRVVVAAIRHALLEGPSERDEASLQKRLAGAVSGHHGVFFSVADASGKQVYASPGPDLSEISKLAPVSHVDANALFVWQDQQKTYRGAVVRIEFDGHVVPYTVIVAAAMDFHLHYLMSFQRTLWLATLLASFAAILAAWLAVYQGHSPLRGLSSKIRGISSDRLHLRLASNQVPIELAELVESFNAMLQRIEDGFRRLSNFSADIAHELRTPVTNLTTQTQVVLSKARSIEEYREILYSNLEEYERMAKMIGDMLFLAQTDNLLLKPERSSVDLVAEVQALFDYFEAWAEERGVSLRLDGSAPALQGDRLMLRRALSNLLSNAIRHTTPGQSVTISLASENNLVRIRVENPGSDIPPEHLSRLFDRFYRVDPSRQRKGDGAGLGLSIVKSIIDAHEGRIVAMCVNGRAVFEIALPQVEDSTD
ncbi:MAG: Cu(+)/Ag(+) sensor histidine kinase [Sulfuricellaceae bacterium]|nr:Cu(+)/Ag(+) sensor histidine kinase [Sulfuricellaceae bacterium]